MRAPGVGAHGLLRRDNGRSESDPLCASAFNSERESFIGAMVIAVAAPVSAPQGIDARCIKR